MGPDNIRLPGPSHRGLAGTENFRLQPAFVLRRRRAKQVFQPYLSARVLPHLETRPAEAADERYSSSLKV
jgi:hypothetical protein